MLFVDFFCHECGREVASESFGGDEIVLKIVGDYPETRGWKPYYEIDLLVDVVCEKCDSVQEIRIAHNLTLEK